MFKCVECFESFTYDEVWKNEEAGNRGCPCCGGEMEGQLPSHRKSIMKQRFDYEEY